MKKTLFRTAAVSIAAAAVIGSGAGIASAAPAPAPQLDPVSAVIAGIVDAFGFGNTGSAAPAEPGGVELPDGTGVTLPGLPNLCLIVCF